MEHRLIDLPTLRELQHSAGDDFVADLVETFASEAPQLIQEMRDALSAGAGARFCRAAHSLKSNSSTFGATHLAEMARALEIGTLPDGPAPVDAVHRQFEQALSELRALTRGPAGG